MKFQLRMALRELRRGRRKFVFFLLCIAIGVAGLAGIRGFNANLQAALLREARTLMAADMTLSIGKPPTEEQAAFLKELESRGMQIVQVTDTASMAINPANQENSIVEVKAVEAGYPFYGVLELNPSGELNDETALVGQDLLDRLGLKVGDRFSLGYTSFTIAGVITKEPDRVTANFGIGPRVMITQGGLARARLIQFGSRATYKYLFKLASDDQVAAVREELQAAFANDRPRIADFREANPQVRRFLDRMTAFLSLVSIVALLVGGLGVANASKTFIQQKIDAIAIMKCLGATNRKVTGVYITQMMILGVAGSLLGILLGFLIQLVLPRVVGNFLDLALEITLSPVVALQALIVGLLSSVLFTLLPLSAIADVKPALVFRREMAEGRNLIWRALPREVGLIGVIGIGLALISAWMANNLLWGVYFVLGLAGALLVLGGAAWLAVRAVRLVPVPPRWITVRQGLGNLHRPGSQASAVVLALGVGVTVVLAVFLLQRSLLEEVRVTSPAGAPNMFFMGLQEADVPSFMETLRAQPGVEKAPDPTPIVRGRILTINGKTRDQLNLTQDEERWFNFQFSLTFSEGLPPGNDVIQGRWWTAQEYTARPLVSVEQEAAARLHLAPGSVIEFDLEGGNPVKAEVHNIRKTTDIRGGSAYNFVFAPGAFQNVPVTYVAQARVGPGAAGPVQKALVSRYPGLTVFNLDDVLKTVGDVLDRIALVIQFVAGFSVIAGLIILASSIAATKFRRVRDAVLYKTLGATRRKVWRIFATEYAALGLVAGLVGAGLSSAATWAVLKFVMEVKYRLELLPLLVGVGATVALTVAVGVLSTLDVLRAKPLQVLRDE